MSMEQDKMSYIHRQLNFDKDAKVLQQGKKDFSTTDVRTIEYIGEKNESNSYLTPYIKTRV